MLVLLQKVDIGIQVSDFSETVKLFFSLNAGNANNFHYTSQGGSPVIEGVDDAKEMAHTRQACTLLGNDISFQLLPAMLSDSGSLSLERQLICVKCWVLRGDLVFLIDNVYVVNGHRESFQGH